MKETKVHVLARYWYCAEEGKLLFNGVKGEPTETKEKGSIVHNWLANRPKNKTEQKLLALLEREKPFCREVHGVKIFGSPDDFHVNKKSVALEEFKSVHGFSSLAWFERFELCCASCQIKVYMWILEPILQKLGYKLSSEGHIVVYSYNGRFLKKYKVYYDREEVENELSMILSVYTGETPSIVPNQIKCKQCTPPFKERCRAIL